MSIIMKCYNCENYPKFAHNCNSEITLICTEHLADYMSNPENPTPRNATNKDFFLVIIKDLKNLKQQINLNSNSEIKKLKEELCSDLPLRNSKG